MLIKHADIITYITAPRIRWNGQILRTYKERAVKIITERRPTTVRKFGRARLGWEDHVRADLGKMKAQNWSKMAMDKEVWKRTAQQVKTQSCEAQRRRRSRRRRTGECNFSQQQETYPGGRLKGGADSATAGFLLLVAVAFPPLHLQPR